jgi:hypothetical protein
MTHSIFIAAFDGGYIDVSGETASHGAKQTRINLLNLSSLETLKYPMNFLGLDYPTDILGKTYALSWKCRTATA